MSKKISLRAKLMGLLGVFSAISLTIFCIEAKHHFESISKGKRDLAEAIAESYMDKLDRNLFERYGDVQAFASSEAARSGNPNRIVGFMNELMSTYSPIYDVMIAVNAFGKVIAVNTLDKKGRPLDTSSLLGKNYSNEVWFKTAMGGGVEPGKAFVQELSFDSDIAKITGGAGGVMTFTTPIRESNTGEILGVWTNRMSWADVVGAITAEEIAGVKTDEMRDIFAFLLNADGKFLVHPESDKVLKSNLSDFQARSKAAKDNAEVEITEVKENYFKGEVMDSLVRSKGYSSYPGQGWYAQVQISTADRALSEGWLLAFISIGVILLGLIAGWWVIRGIISSLEKIMGDLNQDSGEVRISSSNITQGSQNLASASAQQAAALQQTASSVEEMNAMIKKSSENADRSRDISNASHQVAERGKKTVEEMKHAIEDINQSNERIMAQIHHSNEQISEIVKVITEIGNKTKVINDIVFQTKLLSFNASVEAARAGEHGKGFAVVAEEVGNLAQMSGNASKEIADMLTGSIQKVQAIVTETSSKVQRLIDEGKEKVETGTIVVKQCSEILDEVVKNVTDVNSAVTEIASASKEQSQGITEITRAMNQLDQATHENAATSQQTAHEASNLSRKADEMMKVVHGLQMIVNGSIDTSEVLTYSPPATFAPSNNFFSAQSRREMQVESKSKSTTHTAPTPISAAAPKVELKSFGNGKGAGNGSSNGNGHSKVPGKPLFGKAVGADHIPAENDPRFKDY